MIAGRDAELRALAGVLDDAQHGVTRTMLLVGDAGMGKSTLLRATEEMARERGFRIARTGSPEGSDQLRYALVEDLVAGLAQSTDQLRQADAAVLAALAHGGAPGPDRVAAAVLHLLQAAERSGPVLLVADDIHWADDDSRAALTLALGRVNARRVALLAAARPRPTTDARVRALDRIDVGPLDPAAAEALLRQRLPERTAAQLTPDRAAHLVAALGCHPLALAECARLLTPDQILGGSAIPDPLPLGDRLMDAWGGAFLALEAPARTAALVVCVARASGSRLTARVLTECGLRESDLEPGTRAGLLTGPARCSADVVHPLVSAAIRAVAGPDLVRQMHRTAAAAAADLGLGPATIIAHLSAGADPGDAAAVATLEALAHGALEAGAPATAARGFFACARLEQDAQRRGQLAARAARTVLGYSRNLTWTGPLLDFLATETLRDEDRVWAQWLRAEHLAERDLRLSVPALLSAARLARQVDSSALARILWSAIHLAWAVGDADAGLAAAEEYAALPATDLAPAPPWAGPALLGLTRFQAGDIAGAEGPLAHARAMADAWRMGPQTDLGYLTAVVQLDEALGQRRPLGDPRLEEVLHRSIDHHGESLAFLRNIQAVRALRSGDLLVARELVAEGLALSRAVRFRQDVVLRLCTLVRIDAITGDSKAVKQNSDELRALSRQLGHMWAIAFADRAEGLLALAEGRLDDALRHLEPLAQDRTLGLGPDHPVLRGRGDLVEALVRSGEPERARELARGLATLLAPSSDPAARALVAEVLGLVAPGKGAAELFSTAIAWHREAGDAFQTARARLLLGEWLRRDRRPTRARQELRAAAADFERLGARPWQARALAELRAAGTPAPISAPDVWASLTAQERRVAEAVAQGASNREVAAALFLSPRTVEHHLASVYRKLGLTSRTALALRLPEGHRR